MTHPVDLTLQAAGLWLRAASLGVRAATFPVVASARLAGAVCERMTPSPAPEPVDIAVAEPPAPPVATAEPEPEPEPSPKARRRAARREPTPGEAARVRRVRSDAQDQAAQETDAMPGPGAEVQVAEPWEGYAGMTAAQVVQRLAGVDDTTRAAVRLYEGANRGRKAVLHATEA